MNKRNALLAAMASLNSALDGEGLHDLDHEQAEALEDDSQWPAMLCDFEARLGLDVLEAREFLCAYSTEDERLETLREAVEDNEQAMLAAVTRDDFAHASGAWREACEAYDGLADAFVDRRRRIWAGPIARY